MRIVADTNVIVSALVFGGVPRKVLELADRGLCDLFYSEAIEVEVRRVLLGKFGWKEGKLDEVLPMLWSMGERVVPRQRVDVVHDDPGRQSDSGVCVDCEG